MLAGNYHADSSYAGDSRIAAGRFRPRPGPGYGTYRALIPGEPQPE